MQVQNVNKRILTSKHSIWWYNKLSILFLPFYVIDIGTMKSLETLNVCKNRLTELPLGLAKSTSIVELFLNDNNLIEIPTKIMSMQNLKVFEAERKQI